MKIRPFDWDDFKEILEFHKELHDEFYPELNFSEDKVDTFYRNFYESKNAGMFVAEENKKVVGNILFKSKSTPMGIKVCHVSWIFVKKDSQNKGIGTLLLNEAKNFAKERNIQWITLNTNLKNKEALEFYKNKGFEEFQVRLRKRIG